MLPLKTGSGMPLGNFLSNCTTAKCCSCASVIFRPTGTSARSPADGAAPKSAPAGPWPVTAAKAASRAGVMAKAEDEDEDALATSRTPMALPAPRATKAPPTVLAVAESCPTPGATNSSATLALAALCGVGASSTLARGGVADGFFGSATAGLRGALAGSASKRAKAMSPLSTLAFTVWTLPGAETGGFEATGFSGSFLEGPFLSNTNTPDAGGPCRLDDDFDSRSVMLEAPGGAKPPLR
mmetsp:Transcript_79295/g.227480  ORF Transcript_79295/g.227480 Transcript_79295/m.227480 type:complete len:240 (-) Transcript_79295:987-1706(-)